MRPKRTSPLPRVAVICVRCDKPFTRTAGEIRKYPNAPTFCSRACYRPSSPPVLSADGETAAIPLYGSDGAIRAYATIDAADVEWVSQWRWCLIGQYAAHNERIDGRNYAVYLHRALLGLPTPTDGREGDHIDRDKLNCRRSNLRVATRQQNSQNVSAHGGTSRYRGVHWDTQRGKWHAQVMVNGSNVHAGFYADELEAAEAARQARAQLMPFSPD